ncbi:PREDICTED: putative disease resistance RPP13-like protein 1-like [Fragaria vesca subsp. vesca]
MALELVGGAFLSSFLSVLFDRLASRQVVDFISKQKVNYGLLRKLKMKLLSVNAVLDDAEDKQFRNPNVREWLDELKHALYVAGDLLDEITTEALGSQVHDLSSTNSTFEFDKSMEHKLFETLERLELIMKEKDEIGLKESFKDKPQPARSLEVSSLVNDFDVYGREEDKKFIINLLLSDNATDDKLSVVPVVGMGGIGKTTLAQLVYNDERVKLHFDLQAWVCVSVEFDILRTTQKLYGSITSQSCGVTELDLLQVKLKELLTDKKFLLVLDDVWNENNIDWDVFKRPFESGARGSKIIVTTRIEGVSSVMGTVASHRLMQMSEEDCWLLFAKHAFKNADVLRSNPNLEVIGRQIVGKCKGLPLAAKSLGGLLRSELSIGKWENVLKSDLWDLSDREMNILPALWLSYHHLPSHLKRCFAYCSIFPKGYEFKRSELVLLWMAEDLLQPKNKKTLEEIGEDYFDILISRSFFQHLFDNYHHDPIYTMHDLINDLAKVVSGDFCIRLEEEESINNVSKARHFSYIKSSDHGFEKFEALCRAKYLRTFLPFRSYSPHQYFPMSNKVLYDLLPMLQYLRVLNLSDYDIKELPGSICNLKHLRHLDLSRSSIEKLPDTLCSLYNLQTLVLRNCGAISTLPSHFGRLLNLRYLDLRGTGLEKMPPNMGKLKNLQVLTDFILDKHSGYNIAELKELQNLRGTLHISGLHNIIHVGDALEANMRDKKNLTELALKWGDDIEDSQKDREVLEKLQPHTNLKDLVLELYGGTRFPDWLGDESFSNLAYVRFSDCNFCCFLPPLGQLPSLRTLWIQRLNEVVSIGPEFYGSIRNGVLKPFRSLKELRIMNMMEWREWYDLGGNTEGGVFPNLCGLHISNCPKLSEILPLDNFPKLEWLELWNLESFSGSLPQESHCVVALSLSRLEIWGCPNFACFPSYSRINAPKLADLDIHTCMKFQSLPEQMHTFGSFLQHLTIRNCPELESFPEGGLPPALKSLEFHCSKRLFASRSQWGLSRLSSLRKLIIRFKECEAEVDSFPEEGMLPTSLTSLSFSTLPSAMRMDGKELKRLTSLEDLAILDCPELRTMPERQRRRLA